MDPSSRAGLGQIERAWPEKRKLGTEGFRFIKYHTTRPVWKYVSAVGLNLSEQKCGIAEAYYPNIKLTVVSCFEQFL